MQRYKLRQGLNRPDPNGEWVKWEDVERLHELLGEFIEECPSSVEYSDWPELQTLVDRALQAVGDASD